MEVTGATAVAPDNAQVMAESKAAALTVDDDMGSSGTDVAAPSEEGEMVAAPPAESAATTESAAAPTSAPMVAAPFKVVLPEPVEAAMTMAMQAVAQWWQTFEPQMRKLTEQLMVQLEPFIKTGADGLKQLELKLQPQKEQAMALYNDWKAKLEPYTSVALANLKTATEAARVRAYEPALAFSLKASEAIKAQCLLLTALIKEKSQIYYAASQEWVIKQQPLIAAAQKEALAQAQAALTALAAFQKELEPHVKALQEKAVEKGKELGAKTIEAYEKSLAPQVEEVKGKAAAQYKVYEGQVLTATAPMREKVMTATAPLREKATTQLATWGKQLEAPTKAVQQWLLQTAHCMCLPFAPDSIKYQAMDQPDYPPPVTAPGAQLPSA